MFISLETNNHCNANCLFCRNEKGDLHDANPNGSGIAKGIMPTSMAKNIIDQLSKYALIAVLYTNGEPLLHADLTNLVDYATKKNLSTMIATNGLALDENKSKALLESGIDFIKIALSGYTQKTYQVQVRNGDVEKVKTNIQNLVRINNALGQKTIIMIDYILYKFNASELKSIKNFCNSLGIMLNIRPGNPFGGLENTESTLTKETLPLKISCDWLWKGMQINWNGDILPCCECTSWSGSKPYERFVEQQTDLLKVWNENQAQKMRHLMTQKGRKSIDVCSACLRKGIAFKW